MKISKNNINNLGRLIRPQLPTLAFGTVFLVFAVAVNLGIPQILRHLVDADYFALISQHSTELALGLVLLFGIQAIFFHFRSMFFYKAGEQVVYDLRQKLYQSLLAKKVVFFETHNASDLVSRLSADCAHIQDFVGIRLSVFVRYGLQVVAGIVMMFFISAWLAFLILLGLPVLIGISVLMGKRLKLYSKQQQSQIGLASQIAGESLANIKIIKSFNRIEKETSRFEAAIQEVLFLGAKRSELAAFFSSFVSFLMNAFIVLVLLYGFYLVSNAALSTGELTAFMLYGVIVAVSFGFIAGTYAEISQAFAASERVFELLGPSDSEQDAKTETFDKSGTIYFDQVNFSYPLKPERLVLSNLSLEFPSGKFLSIVGPSGSGKSSLLYLLLRFYEPNSGSIHIGNQSIAAIRKAELRNHFSYVPQDPMLFNISLAENLRYGNPGSNDSELQSICQDLGLWPLISGLPSGLNTSVGDAGSKLSSGEKQRIAIARAILKQAPVLLLDEATSALDSHSEDLVLKTIAKRLPGKTVIMVAHRLAHVSRSDQIYVMQSGKILEVGDHQTLLRKNGLYKSMVEKQELSSTPEATLYA